jgi:hypothetical protein
MAKSHPINSGGCSPALSKKLSGERIINNPKPTCISGNNEKKSIMPPTI